MADHLRTFLTIPEAADELRVSEDKVKALIADGRLPAVRLGPRTTRIPREGLEALIASTHFPQADPVPAA